MRILSPAKINLFLKITGKRPDGYHELVSLMCCVGLYDTVSLTFGAKKTSVSCIHPDVPKDETNLAFVDIFWRCSNATRPFWQNCLPTTPMGTQARHDASGAHDLPLDS